ncbi:MAG TPA: DUF6259 domain-containing protein [Verrucomicrobiota bacterium]|nr:DUF6259 domain-containing protein [Verrucomicrobiota bacterium]HNU99185.1 DUF6259 domain-containing protein [Verrucomicrobiota bacterium]HOA60966.1 DUF6259 domain-containing protein [Verrucomicrobiota bacterium]HOF48596.1 DUF6259 domain-containing protein [Verrucomicrobiota bacterium]HOG86931.1 DUF6259 domain-containing protein [Verrucomicrobiota bacterium]
MIVRSILTCFLSAVRRGVAPWLGATVIAATASANVVQLENQSLVLGVDSHNGRILELADRASGQDFANAAHPGDLWELEFDGAPPRTVAPADARVFRIERLRGSDRGLRLDWSGFGLPDAPALRIEVIVRLDRRRALSRWQLAVDAPGERTIQRIRFPRVHRLPRLERECLAVPFWAGLLARNPRHIFAGGAPGGVRREYDYPGHCSMQCLAFYSESGPGLYFACDDTAGYRKAFAAFSTGAEGPVLRPNPGVDESVAPEAGEAPDLNLEIVHLPDREEAVGRRYTLPYSAIIGAFQGKWFDAAEIYRAWATNQTWARESRWKRKAVPHWIADTGLWIWNRGRSPGVIEPAVAFQREIGLPVSVFWHWWHGCAYDTGFPEYLPPREGNASFMAALDRAHASDVRALVYMNQRLWGMTTESWTNENAATYAVKAADGRVRPEVYNVFTKLPCATMCLGTEFWRSKYAGLAIEAFNRLGVDGIYMDQACSSLVCLDSQHGHPPGGGTYWMNGFKALESDIRQRCPTRGGVALAGEGCAENWLPHLDLMLALDVSRERYAAPDGWEPIPFFHAVYHGYGVFYGNYSSLTMPPYDDLWPAEFAPQKPLELLDRRFSRQFYLEQARSFIWGQQPTLANFQPSQFRERPDEIAYVMRLARLRKLALDYLQDGAMLPPPNVETPHQEIPISRLSIYAGQREALKEFQMTVPLVLASAWRAVNGRMAVAVASIADQPLTPTIRLDAARCGLSRRARVEPIGEPPPIACKTGFDGENLELRPALAPLEARVWTLDP